MHKKTFNISFCRGAGYNTPDDYFDVDCFIAPAIQVLNRKGYTTVSCCTGHPFDTIFELNKREVKKFLLCTDEAREAISKGDDCFYKSTHRFAYVLFKTGISLPVLPSGFFCYQYHIFENQVCIQKHYKETDVFLYMDEIVDS